MINKIHKYLRIIIIYIIISFIVATICKIEYYHFVTERKVLKDFNSCGKVLKVQVYKNNYYVDVQFSDQIRTLCKTGVPENIGDELCINNNWNFLFINTQINTDSTPFIFYILHYILIAIIFIFLTFLIIGIKFN